MHHHAGTSDVSISRHESQDLPRRMLLELFMHINKRGASQNKKQINFFRR